MVADGFDLRAVQVTVAAQQALGLLDHTRAVWLAGFEEQLVADRVLAGLDMELVGRAVQPRALTGDTGIEDVADDDPDLADHRALGLERVGRGERLARTGWQLRDRIGLGMGSVWAASASGASASNADAIAPNGVRCRCPAGAR